MMALPGQEYIVRSLPARPDEAYPGVTSVTCGRKGVVMRISDILRGKGTAVATITATTTVTGLLAELAVHNIGAMVVVGADGVPVGIVSERDVVRWLHQQGADVLRRPVAEIMSDVAVTCTPDDSVDDLAALMTRTPDMAQELVCGRWWGLVL